VRRLPVAAFVALVIATVAAFFVTQALKVTTPLLTGSPAPVPSAIDPVSGGTCLVRDHRGVLRPVSFKRMRISFYLLNQADVVDVSIVSSAGTPVVTLPGSGRSMGIRQRRTFVWDGRERNGRLAPDGVYYIRVSLRHQGRVVTIANSAGTAEPVTVQTKPLPLRITGLSPVRIPPSGGSPVTIRYTGNGGLRPLVMIYRSAGRARPRLVKQYAATSRAGLTVWNGTLRGGAPAPAGTYLVALGVKQRTCSTVTVPARLPPTPATAPNAVVTVQ
jgi:hypothetical protein